ncbi:hypothetical protein [Nocardiopsis prasina]|uniref:hypothetical protein n=1 Tax=Nocardiopsis prasina TaxID=2015 RepID=UPI0019554404
MHRPAHGYTPGSEENVPYWWPAAATLGPAVQGAVTKAYVIRDGTLPPIDRAAVDRPFLLRMHKRHGMRVRGP